MYNQLFYTLPNFIDQWVDTRVLYDSIASFSPRLASAVGNIHGTINPEVLTDIDAGYIIIFQVLISSLVMKFKPLNAMISGFLFLHLD